MSNEPPKVSPAVRKAMLDDFEVLENQVQRLSRANGELTSTNESLIKEVGLVREELDKRTKEFQKVQAYAVRLTTQLDMVGEAVQTWMDHGTSIRGLIEQIKSEALKSTAYANGNGNVGAKGKDNGQTAASPTLSPQAETELSDAMRLLKETGR